MGWNAIASAGEPDYIYNHDCIQTRGPAMRRSKEDSLKTRRSIVLAACVYALRCLCPRHLPTNEGLFRQVDIVTEPGSLVDPPCGAPVAPDAV